MIGTFTSRLCPRPVDPAAATCHPHLPAPHPYPNDVLNTIHGKNKPQEEMRSSSFGKLPFTLSLTLDIKL